MIPTNNVEELLGIEARERLVWKQRGAAANDDGGAFERTCVIYHILKYSIDFRSSCREDAPVPQIVKVTQGGEAFVDDIVIELGHMERYIQAKCVQNLAWSYKLMYEDFIYQRILGLHYEIPCQYELWVGYEDRVTYLRDTREDFDVPEVVVEHLSPDPNLPSLEDSVQFVANCRPDSKALRNTIAFVDKAWMELDQSAFISDVMQKAHENSDGIVNSMAQLHDDVAETLAEISKIDGLWISANQNILIFDWKDGPKKLSGAEHHFDLHEIVRLYVLDPVETAADFWRLCTSL